MRKSCMLSLNSLLGKRLTTWWANIKSITFAPSSVLKDIFKNCITYTEILLRQRMHAFTSATLTSKALWALLTIITFSVKRKNILEWMMLLWLIVWRETLIISLSLSFFPDRPQKVSNPLFFMNMFKPSSRLTKSYNNSNTANLVSLQLLVLCLLNLKLFQIITSQEPRPSL